MPALARWFSITNDSSSASGWPSRSPRSQRSARPGSPSRSSSVFPAARGSRRISRSPRSTAAAAMSLRSFLSCSSRKARPSIRPASEASSLRRSHVCSAALPAARIASYASTGDRAFVSADGRTTFALVDIPARGGVDQGQPEARLAQKALAGVTVGGASVRVTGLDALRATGNDSRWTGTGVLLGTLLAALGALLVLVFVFRSFTAIMPLLMAVVAIPTTFLLIWPLDGDHRRVGDRPVPGRADRARDRDRLRAADRRPLARGAAAARHDERRGSAERDATRRLRRGLQRHDRRHLVARACSSVPIPALRSIGIAGLLIALVSVAVGVTLLPVVLATVGPKVDWPRNQRDARPSRAWSSWARLVVRHRWVAAAASCRSWRARPCRIDDPVREPPRRTRSRRPGSARVALDNLTASGIGTGPLSPFDALVRSGDPAAVAKTFATVKGVRAAVAPATGVEAEPLSSTVIPTEDGNSPAGRATLDRLRADRSLTARSRSAARPPRAPTSSTRSTATSRC